MEKPIIGMISPRTTSEDKPFDNYTKFINTYPKRIIEAGGVPIGIIFPNGKFEIEQMDICDGFLLQGGPIIESAQINTIKYAIDKNKPILGICLGMQTMAAYNWIYDVLKSVNTYEEIDNFFKPEYEKYFLEIKKGHNNLEDFHLSEIEKAKHEIRLDMNSKLYKIYKKPLLRVPSLHNYALKGNTLSESPLFKISAKSFDGTIEAIEGVKQDSFILGVQYHPELEDIHKPLFKKLVKEAKKQR